MASNFSFIIKSLKFFFFQFSQLWPTFLTKLIPIIFLFLVIRASELHTHYEKLLPAPSSYKHSETFVPIPYFSDFLVVHQYNAQKCSMQSTYADENANTKRESNFTLDKQLTNLETLNIYPTRKSNRTNNWRGSQLTNEAKVGDFDLNHLFILNKRTYLIC